MKKPEWVIEKERAKRAAAAETLWLFGLHAVRDALMNMAHPEDREMFKIAFKSVSEAPGPFHLRWRLIRADGASVEDVAAFRRLLGLVGVGDADAIALSSALLDWLDADDLPRLPGGAESAWYGSQDPPRRAANARLAAVAELKQIRGFTPDLVARLTPFVAALPPDTTVNVNTAPAEVIAAVVPGLGLDGARQVVAQRARAWFKDVADFTARLPAGNASPDTSHIATTSRHFLATGRARFGVSTVRMEVLLDRSQKWPDIVWQKLL